MAIVHFQQREFALEPGESVLDCLLRNGQTIAHSCKSGLCQSCLVQAEQGQPSTQAQRGLKNTLQASGHALACQWQPDTDVAVRLPNAAGLDVPGRISGMELLNELVMKVLVTPDAPALLAECRAGQYLSLTNSDGITRSYSIANMPQRDGHFEFHIAATQQGLFSGWIFRDAQAGDSVRLRGPAGACFYVAEGERSQPLLLVGTGTGLAPLHGIVHDALMQGHRGPLTLLHASTTPASLYYREELSALARAYPNFRYHAVVLQGPGDDRCTVGDAVPLALQQLATETIGDTRLFLCGNPGFVQTLRKQAFLKGVRSAHIHSDPFVERPVEPPATT
jgi:ferredoxin-NADP reductase/ferredoxin